MQRHKLAVTGLVGLLDAVAISAFGGLVLCCDDRPVALHSRKEREAIMREIRQRRGDPRHGFVREMRLLDGDGDEDLGYAAGVPAVAALRDGLQLDPRVTSLVGENGSGKSTLVEALAVACKLNAEGGGRNLRHATRESHSRLGDHLRLVRGTRTPKTDFFLRAESLYTVATMLEEMPEPEALAAYGGTRCTSSHTASHSWRSCCIASARTGSTSSTSQKRPSRPKTS